MRARGMTPGSVIRSQAVVPASEVVARHLAIVPGSPVVHLERVRTADGEPMALERTHLPAQRLPGLESADLTDAFLYELLERTWDIRVADADQWASVVRLTGDEAAILQVDADQPALLFQRLTRDPAGAPSGTSVLSTAATATRSTPTWNAATANPARPAGHRDRAASFECRAVSGGARSGRERRVEEAVMAEIRSPSRVSTISPAARAICPRAGFR